MNSLKDLVTIAPAVNATTASISSIPISYGGNGNAIRGYTDIIDEAAKSHLRIGNLKLTQEEYETCMTYLLELTKKAKPEEFI